MEKCKQFLDYFFGKGETEEFTNFTLAHFLPILVAAGVIYLIYLFRHKIASDEKLDKRLRMTLALALIITEMSYYWRLVGLPDILEPNPIDHLPITVCGWAVVLSSYLMVSKNQTLFDISYFFLLCATIFALITPTVITYTGPTRFRYYQFWLEHTLGYLAIFYMMFVHKMRPTIKSAVKALSALLVLGGVALFANNLLGPGANYLYVARPESTPSILDILPSNYGLRLAIMVAAVLTLFFLAYLPWLIMDIRAKKKGTVQANEQV